MSSFRLRSALAFLPLALALLAAPRDVRAQEWPMFRHDALRTGASDAIVSIDEPALLFRRYLGGALTGAQVLVHDVDGDGVNEVIYVSGGRVVAKRGDNVALWESDILPVDTLWAVVDFDRDGEDELLL